MRLFRDLWSTSPTRTALVVAVVALCAAGTASASALAGPVLIHRSGSLFGCLVAALIVVAFGNLLLGLLSARLTLAWAADVRRRLCHVAFGQDLPALESTPVGELLDRIDGDVYQVAAELRGAGVQLAQAIASAVVGMLVAMAIWWPAGLAMMTLAVLLILALRERTKAIAPARMGEEEAWSDMTAVMEEAIHGQDDVRTSLARPYVLRLFASRTAVVLGRGRLVWTMAARITATATATTYTGIAVVVLCGTYGLTRGWIDAARLTAVWLLTLSFGAMVARISRMLPELQYALGAWGRIQQLSDRPQEPLGGLSPPDGDLSVRGLTFRYPQVDDTRPAALFDVDLDFVRGRSYAVVGRTGSGKSTLAKVLTRAVEVPRGTVRLGGTDLVDLDLSELRRWIGVVPQRTEILAGTVAENVALFEPALMPAAEAAMAELGLETWVAELPDGMGTRLGEGGLALSAGQEQLVAFARLLVRSPRIVILDEATARLDPVTEEWVRRATQRLLRDRIGIVIAHRLSSVRHCDEIVLLADGAVVEAGPLATSARFAALLAAGGTVDGAGLAVGGIDGAGTAGGAKDGAGSGGGDKLAATGGGGLAATGGADPVAAEQMVQRTAGQTAQQTTMVLVESQPARQNMITVAETVAPPAVPCTEPVRTVREVLRLIVQDPRFGLAATALFLVTVVLGLDGPLLSWLWAGLVDGNASPWPVALAIVAVLALVAPAPYALGRWFPEWWVRQMLRISLRLVHGQTGPRRISNHTAAEVVAQGADTERAVMLSDNLLDQLAAAVAMVAMTWLTGSAVPALLFGGTMVLAGLAALGFGPRLSAAAKRTVAAKAAFATALVSGLSAARTVKLSAATEAVVEHLARLDQRRSDHHRQEISIQVLARSTPSVIGGLLPIAAWSLYLSGALSAGTTLVAIATLRSVTWYAWTTASLVSQLPSTRVWTARTVAMTGVGAYSSAVEGVDLSAGTAPAPSVAPRTRLARLELRGFWAIHSDGTVGVRDVDLSVRRGQLVLVVGPVGSGKSSLLRALAGIVHHTGSLCWNGEQVTEPELFLRPNQVGYVAQLPRVLSGTIADNIVLDQDLDPRPAVATAQLEHDLAGNGAGLGMLIGHKGTRLSGGQLQRLALARALAQRTELLIADDVSSALDVTTELRLWRALREQGITVIGSTSKLAALLRADQVLVLQQGRVAAVGTWADLAPTWGHLAG